MRRLGLGTLAIVGCVILASSDVAYPCAALRAQARIDLFTCPCPDGSNGNLETPILVVTGSLSLGIARATPTLASVVVELQTRGRRRWSPVARQVLDAADSSIVTTCRGTFAAGPVAGRIVFVDAEGNALTFDQVKHLPEGTTVLNYVATFAGPLPGITPGKRARVKVYTTAIGVHALRTCTVDADRDGRDDAEVKTLVFQRFVRVPAIAPLITP